jgi:hypothetical protein
MAKARRTGAEEDTPMSDFTPLEKVRILLAEHSALRAEFVARTGHGYLQSGVISNSATHRTGDVGERPLCCA